MCWSGIPLFSIPKGMEQPGREEQCLSWGRTDPSWRCLLPALLHSCLRNPGAFNPRDQKKPSLGNGHGTNLEMKRQQCRKRKHSPYH